MKLLCEKRWCVQGGVLMVVIVCLLLYCYCVLLVSPGVCLGVCFGVGVCVIVHQFVAGGALLPFCLVNILLYEADI